MIEEHGFHYTNEHVGFKKDKYPLSKIKAVRMKTNSWKDHAVRGTVIGLVVSSVVGMVCAEYFGSVTLPFSFLCGLIAAIVSSRRYELQIEFQHSDGTGCQWISMAKTNKKSAKAIFEQQVEVIATRIVA